MDERAQDQRSSDKEPVGKEESEDDDTSSSQDGGVVGEDEFEDHYDPAGDEDDLEQLTKARAELLGLTVEQVMRMHTDAILSCPGCFSTVCSFGSQRHARYRHQYRAILADNVVVHMDVLLNDPRASGVTGFHGRADDAYYRVSCGFCGTDVGLQDAAGQQRAYHFYHVLPSEA